MKPFWILTIHPRMVRIQNGFMKKTPARRMRGLFANWMIDGKTRETSTVPSGPYAELDKIKVPFVVVQNLGYFNLHQFGSYHLFHHPSTPEGSQCLILRPAPAEPTVHPCPLDARP